MTKKTKLSGSVAEHHCYIDKQRQVNGERAIRQRKRQEKKQLNESKFVHIIIMDKLFNETKRQKVSDQIQRGFDLAKEWKDEEE